MSTMVDTRSNTSLDAQLVAVRKEYDRAATKMEQVRDKRREAALAAYEDGMTRRRICIALDITEYTLSDWIKKSGTKTRR